MAELIQFVLAVVGLAALAGVAMWALLDWLENQSAEPETVPTAYLDGMEAASRISAASWEADQALYRAAWREHNE